MISNGTDCVNLVDTKKIDSNNKSYNYIVDTQKVDFRNKISLSELMKFILAAAGRNAEENGFGLPHLMTMDCSWVLSRFYIEMYKMPEGDETITIETWIEDAGAATTTRNFKLYDNTGEVIGGASSVWAIINLISRRSMALETIGSCDGFVTGEKGFTRKPRKVLPFDGELSNKVDIKYSDLDINEHVNTLKYVRWVSDCFSPDFYRDKRIKEFEINFIAEMRYGDFAEVHMKETLTSEEFCFDIKNSTQKSVCRSRLLFAENK